jgi:lipoate-protein ligase A
MRLLERVGADPRGNLAVDARLFEALEAGAAGETLRLWESRRPAVVVGRFSDIGREVDERACRADGVPIVRRISGGGAVVIGRGCLNYALALSLDRRPELRDVAASYDAILAWVAEAAAVPGLRRAGQSDLALDDRKIGGSAQRRGRRALLHHGTLLYAFETGVLDRYLKLPARQPAYRRNRPHAAFVTNAPIEPYLVSKALVRILAA